MFTEDFVLRMINQALAALMTILKLKKAGDYQAAQQAIDQAFEQLVGLKVDIIDQLDDESFLKVLTQQGRLDLARLGLIADLFNEQGGVYAALDRITESRESYLRALTYQLEVGFGETTHPSPELKAKIESLIQKLGAQTLPDGTLWTLFCYYEQSSAYRKADEAILMMVDRPQLDENIRPELIAFYERLLERPESELAEGGLDREQVVEKLEKAKQDSGHK